jgi:HPt (histidine-containing phosphotransfer) domain-containing protein
MEEEILNLLLKELPVEFLAIKEAKINNNFPDLIRRIHKLHGAVCYCNVPDLKKSIVALENALKQNKINELDNLFAELDHQIHILIPN